MRILLITFLAIVASCSNEKAATSTASRDDVKGHWQLDKVSYQGLEKSGTVKLTLLDEGNEKCLEGSLWDLPNNGYGSYTIASNATGCTAGKRSIIWSTRNEGGTTYFQYKILPGGVRAKDVADGYKMKIVSASSTAMQIQSETSFEGKAVTINYDFSRK